MKWFKFYAMIIGSTFGFSIFPTNSRQQLIYTITNYGDTYYRDQTQIHFANKFKFSTILYLTHPLGLFNQNKDLKTKKLRLRLFHRFP